MGFTSYCSDSRSVRAAAMSYSTAPVDVTFTQQRERKVHDLMNSRKVKIRECRDSEAHPNTVPIILALDVTGSMGSVPRQLIADGLPTLMSKIIQSGIADASLLFLAVGDHESDRYPVQVAQFESGDAELDMWLTRTYLEGGGGGNAGESYPLAWEFAANRVVTDAWEKRKEKGFLFTIGDEPFLKNFPASAFKEIYGENAGQPSTVSAEKLYEAACEKFNIFHISLNHGWRASADPAWTELMGQRHLQVDDHNKIPNLVADTILANTQPKNSQSAPKKKKSAKQESVQKTDSDTDIPAML